MLQTQRFGSQASRLARYIIQTKKQTHWQTTITQGKNAPWVKYRIYYTYEEDIRGAYSPNRCGIRGAYPQSRCGISDLYHVTAAL